MLKDGQQIGRYKVLSPIGAGGMGEVYLAEDTRLRRKVALKILPEDIAKDSDRLKRFEQEAFAASALNHPNIITIYEISETDDQLFIATEYIEGKTLRERIEKKVRWSSFWLFRKFGAIVEEVVNLRYASFNFVG